MPDIEMYRAFSLSQQKALLLHQICSDTNYIYAENKPHNLGRLAHPVGGL